MKKEMGKKKSSSSGKKNNVAKNISSNIFQETGELEEKLRKLASDVSIKDVRTDYDVTRVVKFRVQKHVRIPDFNGFPIYPMYKLSRNQLVFNFDSKKFGDKKKKEAKKSSPQAEKVAALMFSTARYQILLDGFRVKDAYLFGAKEGKKTRLNVIRLGDQSMIDFPFLSALVGKKSGFKVYINLE